MKIKAAVVREAGAPFSIEEVELAAPKADELLVKMVAVGVCHTDEAGRAGELPFPFPVVLGHEGAGIVEAVGSAVTDFQPGDSVCMSFGTCGVCENCYAGKPYACERMFPLNFFGKMADGTTRLSQNGKTLSCFFAQSSFAEYAVVSRLAVVKIDKDIDLGLAAPMGCGIQTRRLRTECAETRVRHNDCGVWNRGGRAERHHGRRDRRCSKVIAIDKIPSRLELAKEIGATHVINAPSRRTLRRISRRSRRAAWIMRSIQADRNSWQRLRSSRRLYRHADLAAGARPLRYRRALCLAQKPYGRERRHSVPKGVHPQAALIL
jgi:aryl-alcohol dehydrogenase